MTPEEKLYAEFYDEFVTVYDDGDRMVDGFNEDLDPEEVFDWAVKKVQEQREKILAVIEEMQKESDAEFEQVNGQQFTQGYDQALNDLLEKLTQLNK